MTSHNPRYPYDCDNCKLNWNCGPVCYCWVKQKGWATGETPLERKIEVNDALAKYGLEPEFNEVHK